MKGGHMWRSIFGIW